jgi:hypothetical protein
MARKSPIEIAKEDLEYMVLGEYCPIETFWENVGDEQKIVIAELFDIAEENDEKAYYSKLRALMNRYI